MAMLEKSKQSETEIIGEALHGSADIRLVH